LRRGPERSQSAIRVIGLANRFVQGVGQGIQLTLIQDGRRYLTDAGIYSQTITELEDAFDGQWSDVCDLSIGEEEFKLRLKAFEEALLRIHEVLPRLRQLT
jgi:hypothetical protein